MLIPRLLQEIKDPKKANSLLNEAYAFEDGTKASFVKKMMQEKPLVSSDQEKQDDAGAGITAEEAAAYRLGQILPAEAVLRSPPLPPVKLPRTSVTGVASMFSKMGAHDLSKVKEYVSQKFVSERMDQIEERNAHLFHTLLYAGHEHVHSRKGCRAGTVLGRRHVCCCFMRACAGAVRSRCADEEF